MVSYSNKILCVGREIFLQGIENYKTVNLTAGKASMCPELPQSTLECVRTFSQEKLWMLPHV